MALRTTIFWLLASKWSDRPSTVRVRKSGISLIEVRTCGSALGELGSKWLRWHVLHDDDGDNDDDNDEANHIWRTKPAMNAMPCKHVMPYKHVDL